MIWNTVGHGSSGAAQGRFRPSHAGGRTIRFVVTALALGMSQSHGRGARAGRRRRVLRHRTSHSSVRGVWACASPVCGGVRRNRIHRAHRFKTAANADACAGADRVLHACDVAAAITGAAARCGSRPVDHRRSHRFGNAPPRPRCIISPGSCADAASPSEITRQVLLGSALSSALKSACLLESQLHCRISPMHKSAPSEPVGTGTCPHLRWDLCAVAVCAARRILRALQRGGEKRTDKRTSRQTNKQTNKQTKRSAP